MRNGSRKSLDMNFRVGGHKRWTISHQAWAVDEGFFVQPCNDFIPKEGMGRLERPIIFALEDVSKFPDLKPRVREGHHISYANPNATMLTIKNYVKRGHPEYTYLAEFIKQQDEQGYIGAWDRRSAFCSKTLVWYRHYKEARKNGKAGYLTFNGKTAFSADIDDDEMQHDLIVMTHRKALPLAELRRRYDNGTLERTRHEQRREALGLPAWASIEHVLAPPEIDRLERERLMDEECARLAQERIARRGW
jgi:hypothetical protein